MSRRQRPLVLLAVAVLGLGGCGADDADPSAFARTADRGCKDLSTAVARLRTGLVRSSASSQPVALSRALRTYAADVDAVASHLAATPAPRSEATFRDRAVRGLRRHADVMREAGRQARRGRVAGDLRDELRGGSLPAVPASLLEDAPDCALGPG